MNAIVFAGVLGFVAGSLALAAAFCSSVIRLPLPVRMAFAGTLAPFFIAALTEIVATVAPGAPAAVSFLVPIFGALAILFAVLIRWPMALVRISRQLIRGLRRGGRRIWPALAWVGVGVMAGSLMMVLSHNLVQPVIGHDGLIYLSEGRAIAETRSMAAFDPTADPAARLPTTHPHTKLFSAYLANALMTPPGTIGYPNDAAARMAFQATVVLLIGSLGALAGLARRPGASAMTLLAFGLFPTFEYISSASSRDGFRLIPIVVLLGLLYSLAVRRRWSWRMCVPVGLVGALAITGHTINLYFIALLGVAFLIFALIRKARLADLGVLVGVCVAMAALPLSHYARALLTSGNALGDGMNYFQFVGTPLLDAWKKSGTFGLADLSLVDSVAKLWGSQGLAPALVTAVAFVGVLASVFLFKTEGVFVRFALFVTCVLFVFFSVPLSNVLRMFAIDIKEAFLGNDRYPYVAFMLCPLLIAFGVLALEAVVRRFSGRLTAAAALAPLIVAGAAGSYTTIQKWHFYETPQPAVDVVSGDAVICAIADRLPQDAVWLTDRYSIAYYCKRRPIFLYTPEGRAFFAAVDEASALHLLEANRVGLVTLSNADPNWWPSTPFQRALVAEAASHGGGSNRKLGYWDVFQPSLGGASP